MLPRMGCIVAGLLRAPQWETHNDSYDENDVWANVPGLFFKGIDRIWEDMQQEKRRGHYLEVLFQWNIQEWEGDIFDFKCSEWPHYEYAWYKIYRTTDMHAKNIVWVNNDRDFWSENTGRRILKIFAKKSKYKWTRQHSRRYIPQSPHHCCHNARYAILDLATIYA